MIDLLNKWMLESTANFNIVVGLTALLFLGSVIALIIIYKKIGKPVERTNTIYLKNYFSYVYYSNSNECYIYFFSW